MTFADAFAAHEHDEEQDRLAADQIPATDSERDERLREARVAASVYRDAINRGMYTEVKHDQSRVLTLDDEVTRLTALLAEQAATIERVRAVHTSPAQEVRFSDGFVDHVAVCVRCRVIAPCATAEALDATPTALGSHRMEGDRG